MDLENDKQVEAILNMTLGWPYCVQSVFTIKGMFKDLCRYLQVNDFIDIEGC